jgi:hypothetical protein
VKAVPVLTMTARVYVPSAGADAAEIRVRWSDCEHAYASTSWGLTAWRFALGRRPEYLSVDLAAGWTVDRADAVRAGADADSWRWDVGREPFGPPALGAVEVELGSLASPAWAVWAAVVRDLPSRDLGLLVRALRLCRRITHRERWSYVVGSDDPVDLCDVPVDLRGTAAAWASGPEVLRARAALADREAARLREAAACAEEAPPCSPSS